MAKYALLVGVSEYEPGLNPLPAAVKDVEAIHELLLDPAIGGFKESDVAVLKNPERQKMEEAIESLFEARQKDDLVLLFFSGHGIKDDAGRLYLATRGTRKSPQGELIRSTAISSNILHESMSRSRSKRQVVILDSCFSGAFAEGMAAKDDGSLDIRTQLGGEGRAVLTSSSSTQYSFEYTGSELSLYTRFLVDGIKTGAADQDEDGVISIDELHDYASKRVKDIKPEAKPELYTVREGFKIHLAKVPLGDPRERYRKEVARYGKRGDLTIVSRGILDALRTKLELSVEEAKALEDEILEPYRKEFQQKLHHYEQIFTNLLRREEAVNDETRQELQGLQKTLELRNEDTFPIEARVAARIQVHHQNLKVYEQALSEAIKQDYPLGNAKRNELRQMQFQLDLSDDDVSQLEARIISEVEKYHAHLRQYKQAFEAAVLREYPLTETSRGELRRLQQSLGLSDVDVTSVEVRITNERESYQQKLHQYEQAFVKATQYKQHPSSSTRNQLQQTWQTLGLTQADVTEIEAKILAQVEAHQRNLGQYRQEFTDATEIQYPLNSAKRQELRQRREHLNLTDQDVEPIESEMVAQIEAHLKKLQQYEQVLVSSMQYEYPFSEATHEELKRFQQVLELSDGDATRLEAQVVSNRTSPSPPPTTDRPTPSPEKDSAQRGDSSEAVSPPPPTTRPSSSPADAIPQRSAPTGSSAAVPTAVPSRTRDANLRVPSAKPLSNHESTASIKQSDTPEQAPRQTLMLLSVVVASLLITGGLNYFTGQFSPNFFSPSGSQNSRP